MNWTSLLIGVALILSISAIIAGRDPLPPPAYIETTEEVSEVDRQILETLLAIQNNLIELNRKVDQ